MELVNKGVKNMPQKIKVIIVDDEYLAIEDLKNLIDWEGLGFEITATARSGRQALHIPETQSADLIITDISMPGMDGISLIEELRRRNSRLLFLLLTAYAEIDYMKRAFQLGVEDYLMKDEITPELLTEKLLLIREKLESSCRLSYSFLQKSLQAYFCDSAAVYSAADKTLSGSGLFYCILAPDIIFPWVEELMLSKKTSLSRTIAMALPFVETYQTEGVENICSLAAYNNKILVLLHMPETASTSHILYVLQRFSTNLTHELYFQLHVSFSCFYSTVPMTLPCLHQDFFARQKSVRARYFLGCRLTEALDSPRLFITNQKLSFTKDDLQAVYEDPNVRLSDFIDLQFSQVIKEHNYIGLSHLINLVFSFLLQLYITPADLDRVDFTDISCIRAFLIEKSAEAECRKNSSYSRETQRAVSYIEKHYGEEQLSVQDLAKEAGLSITHFSRVFKQDTGETVWDYLTDYRIRKACGILRGTDAKVYEVAEMCGYSSPQYFSQVFYKLIGIKPLDYRKKEHK